MQVLKRYLSEGVWAHLSSDGNAESLHRRFLLNLACGKHVTFQENRQWLVAGYDRRSSDDNGSTSYHNHSHQFDFVISFASNERSHPGRISELPIMFTKLLATSTPVGVIVARHMSPSYLEEHEPVFSGRSFHHVTFVEPSATVPGGRRLVCHKGCGAALTISVKTKNRGKKATVKCNSCKSYIVVRLPKMGFKIPDTMTDQIFRVPGHKLVQTPFPIPIATEIDWNLPRSAAINASGDAVPSDCTSTLDTDAAAMSDTEAAPPFPLTATAEALPPRAGVAESESIPNPIPEPSELPMEGPVKCPSLPGVPTNTESQMQLGQEAEMILEVSLDPIPPVLTMAAGSAKSSTFSQRRSLRLSSRVKGKNRPEPSITGEGDNGLASGAVGLSKTTTTRPPRRQKASHAAAQTRHTGEANKRATANSLLKRADLEDADDEELGPLTVGNCMSKSTKRLLKRDLLKSRERPVVRIWETRLTTYSVSRD